MKIILAILGFIVGLGVYRLYELIVFRMDRKDSGVGDPSMRAFISYNRPKKEQKLKEMED